jgi:hypothetical protein
MSRALASALVEEEGVTVSGLVVDGTTRAINAAVNSSGDGGRYG